MHPLARLAAVPLVAGATLGGVWVAGGRITDDFRVAMALTALWLGAAGLAALAIGYRSRALRLPVVGTFAVVAVALGGYLWLATARDTVVDEAVAAGTPFAAGRFVNEAHTTTGRAELVRLADGRAALTLAAFRTDPGPDLRVYLTRKDGTDVSGALDLGALRGNVGTQQYVLPAAAHPEAYGAVVIWCRAFSVAFGRAELAPA